MPTKVRDTAVTHIRNVRRIKNCNNSVVRKTRKFSASFQFDSQKWIQTDHLNSKHEIMYEDKL